MKNFLIFSLFLFLLLPALPAKSQKGNLQPDCSYILHQADSIKKSLFNQGFIVIKEVSIAMESKNDSPEIVPLTKGSFYQFVFIGDVASRAYEVRMFDWNKKQVAYQKKQWDAGGNVISYSYIPKTTEYHMMKPAQANKKKQHLCGYVMLLKKVK